MWPSIATGISWVLEGRAMQDVWISPPRAARSVPGSSAANRYGTSLRTFVRDNGRWRVRWSNPASGVENQLEGGRDGGNIVLTGLADGHPIRWQFVDISTTHFTWEGFRLASAGEVWELQARFELSRIR